MNATPPNPQSAGALRSLLSLFSVAGHLQLALPHNLAAELESEQMASAYRAGTFPPLNWTAETSRQSEERLHQLRRSLLLSGTVAAALSAAALVVAAAFGKVHPSLPVDYGRCVSSLGGGLAAWGALLQLQPPPQTFRGTLLHEKLHGLLVRVLVMAGLALAALGALWWQ